MKKPKEDELFEISSTYRIFSRAACNFAFPSSIERPVPDVKEGENIDENIRKKRCFSFFVKIKLI